MLETIGTLIHNAFVFVCFIGLLLVIAIFFPIGVAVKSRHHPTCCCDYCDPDYRKSKRLGVRHH
jgi:hypothetical protein